jgi:hypothetical protein
MGKFCRKPKNGEKAVSPGEPGKAGRFMFLNANDVNRISFFLKREESRREFGKVEEN